MNEARSRNRMKTIMYVSLAVTILGLGAFFSIPYVGGYAIFFALPAYLVNVSLPVFVISGLAYVYLDQKTKGLPTTQVTKAKSNTLATVALVLILIPFISIGIIIALFLVMAQTPGLIS